MDSLECLKGSHNFFNIFRVISYKRKFSNTHPTYFYPAGLLVFCAEQGAGKTLSAVQYCVRINETYNNCIFCTNVSIRDYPVNCYYKISNLTSSITIINYYLIENDELVRTVCISDYERRSTNTHRKISRKYKNCYSVWWYRMYQKFVEWFRGGFVFNWRNTSWV